jgi:hypothetical protein
MPAGVMFYNKEALYKHATRRCGVMFSWQDLRKFTRRRLSGMLALGGL